MKLTLEAEDIAAIADTLIERLRPVLAMQARPEPDRILDVKDLAGYLNVEISWIYKQVSYKAIPFFKAGKYTRFKQSAIDKWVDKKTQNPLPPLRAVSGANRK